MIGDLIQTTAGKWIVEAPTHGPMVQRLGPNRCLVGHTASAGHDGGHITWTCRTCDQTVCGHPLNTHCTVLDGPAAVRISFGEGETKSAPATPRGGDRGLGQEASEHRRLG